MNHWPRTRLWIAAGWLAAAPLVFAYPPPKIRQDQIPGDMPPEIRRHIEALYSPVDDEVVTAINALGAMGPAAAPAAPYLAGILETKHPKGPSQAFDALKRIGPAAVESLILTLQLGDRYAQGRACSLLEYFHDDRAIPALVSAMADGIQRQPASRALAAIGEPALNYIQQGLTDKNPTARSRALLATPTFPRPAVIEHVVKAVGDPDEFVRFSALQALAQMPTGQVPVTEPILAALRDPDPRIRRLALERVAVAGGEKAAESLASALADPDRATQLAAISSLGALRTERSAQLLADAANSPEPLVRASVAEALAAHGRPLVIPVLIKLQQDKDPAVRQKAVAGLGNIGSSESVTALLNALQDKDALVRTVAVGASGNSTDPRVRAKLAEMIDDADAAVALQALSMLIRRPPTPVAALLKALRGSRQPLQLLAADALGQVNQPEAATALLEVLSTSKDVELRDRTLQALGRQSQLPTLDPIRAILKAGSPQDLIQVIGILARQHDTGSLEAIVAYLTGPREVALAAARALPQLQPESLPAMFKALSHPDPEVRAAIAPHLERHRDPAVRSQYAQLAAPATTPRPAPPPSAGGATSNPIAHQGLPYYLTMLKNDRPEVRASAAEQLGRDGRNALAPLTEVSADPEPTVRVAAANALGQLRDPAAVPVLIKLVRDPKSLVREAAVRAVGTLADPASLAPLIDALKDDDWHVRWLAADFLGRLKNPAAGAALQAALSDEHWYVRRAAAEALGQVGDKSSIPGLTAAQNDAHWYVRQTAAAALKTLK